MRTGISIDIDPSDRVHLSAVVAGRNSPQKHVWRARIVLLSAEGRGTAEIMRLTGKSKTCVWRWQERFMSAGIGASVREAFDVAVDQAGIGSGKAVVIDPETRCSRCADGEEQYVATRRNVAQGSLGGRLLEIEHNAALVAVVG